MTASDAALMTGARGGVYLAGELIDLIHEDLKQASFSTRFQHKGRLSPYVTEIPVHAIVARDPELIGLSTLFPEAHL
jgi:glucokinase